jgi:bacteriocin biosynthesis cyclodehydratase domain-containing protein
MLKPALRRLWRDPSTLQLGIDPHHAVVLDGIDATDAALLGLFDGSRDTAALSAAAQRLGAAPARVTELVAALRGAAVLDDGGGTAPAEPRHEPDLLSLSLLHRAPGAAPAIMAHRHGSSVEVLGAGRVGATIAVQLAAAGVGRITVTDGDPVRPADFAPGGVRGPAARQTSRGDATRRLLGSAAVARGAGRSDSLAVLAPTGSILPVEWLGQVRHRPHLPVVLRETTAVIGPFVLPGRTACLRCLELTRGDRDPRWPVLAAQLVGDQHGVEASDSALASAAASITALHVLAWLDRGDTSPPPSLGGTVELSLTDLRLRRRTVHPHPGCGCGSVDAPPLAT